MNENETREALQEALERAQKLEQEKQEILLKQEAGKILTEKGLPESFADYLTGRDSQQTLARVEKFEAAYQAAVAKTVKDKLPGYRPEGGNEEEKDPFLTGLMGGMA